MFVSGGRCVDIELRVVLKFLNGWYIKHNVIPSSPLISPPIVIYVWEGAWHTNESSFKNFACFYFDYLLSALVVCLVEGW